MTDSTIRSPRQVGVFMFDERVKKVQRVSPGLDSYVFRFIAYLADTGYHFEQADAVKLKRHAENQLIGIPVYAVSQGLLMRGLLSMISYTTRATGGKSRMSPRGADVASVCWTLFNGLLACHNGVNSWWREVHYDGMNTGKFPSLFPASDTDSSHTRPPPAGAQISHTDVAEKVRAALRTWYPNATGIYHYDNKLLVDDMEHAQVRTDKDVHDFVSKWKRPAGDPNAPSPETLAKLYPSFCSVWANSNLKKSLRGEPVTVRNIETDANKSQTLSVPSKPSSESNTLSYPRNQPINQSTSQSNQSINQSINDNDPFDDTYRHSKGQLYQTSVPQVKLISKLPPEELEKRRVARQTREDARKQHESDRIATIRTYRQLHNTRPMHDVSGSANLVVDPSAPKPVGTNAFGDPVFADFSMK